MKKNASKGITYKPHLEEDGNHEHWPGTTVYSSNAHEERTPVHSVSSRTHEEFMKSLDEYSLEDRAKVEKDMQYLHKIFEDCGSLIEFQGNFVDEIDKNLKEAEENSKSLAAALKKANTKATCQQRVLNGVIISLSLAVVFLLAIAYIKT